MVLLRVLDEVYAGEFSIVPFFAVHGSGVVHANDVVEFLGEGDEVEGQFFLVEVSIIVAEEFGVLVPDVGEVDFVVFVGVFSHEVPVGAGVFANISPFDFGDFSLVFYVDDLVHFNFITNFV